MTFIDGWFNCYDDLLIENYLFFFRAILWGSSVSVQLRTLSKRRGFNSLPWPPNSISSLRTYVVERNGISRVLLLNAKLYKDERKVCEWNGLRVFFDVIALFLKCGSKRRNEYQSTFALKGEPIGQGRN